MSGIVGAVIHGIQVAAYQVIRKQLHGGRALLMADRHDRVTPGMEAASAGRIDETWHDPGDPLNLPLLSVG